MYLRDLPSLKKMASLRDLAESPVDTRFSGSIVSQWSTFVGNLARRYHIPDRISVDDLRQELWVHVWKLCVRVDPISRPDDFGKQLRAELRNKCIDINRYYKARKRVGRTGKAVQCLCCGSVSRITSDDPVECEFCGESVRVRAVETYSRNLPIIHEDDEGDKLIDSGQQQPIDNLVENELLARVARSLDGVPLALYHILTNPSDAFLKYLESIGHDGDHRAVSNRVMAQFLGVHDRVVSDAYSKIRDAVKWVTE